MNYTRIFFGAFIVLIGAILLFNQTGLNINFGSFWPVFLLAPGIFFWGMFYTQRGKRNITGVLIPGTILIIYSLYFFYNELTDYRFAGETSFIFVFGVALGFFAVYYFSKEKSKGMLIPAWILTAVAVIVFITNVFEGRWWPLIIIVIGLFLLLKKEKTKDTKKKEKTDNNY